MSRSNAALNFAPAREGLTRRPEPSSTAPSIDRDAYRAKLQRFNASDNYRLDLARLMAEVGRRPFASMLDAGCGNGTFVEKVREAHPESRVDGVDRFDFGGRDCAVVDLCAREAPALGSYDLVTFVHSINHVADLGVALGRVVASMPVGGRLVVLNPNPAFVAVVRVLNQFGLLQTSGGDATVVRYLGEAEITAAAQEHGLTLASCETYGQSVGCAVHGQQVEVSERLMLVYEKTGGAA